MSVALAIGLVFFIGLMILWRGGNKMFRKTEANLEAIEASSLVMTLIDEDLRRMTLTRKMLVGGPKTPTTSALPDKDQYRFLLQFKDDLKTVDLSNMPQPPRIVLGDGPGAVDSFWFPMGSEKDPSQYVMTQYHLEPALKNPPAFRFVRTIYESGKPKTFRYGTGYVRQISFIVRGTKRDNPINIATAADFNLDSSTNASPDVFWLQVLVVGISPTRDETDFKDYYRAPLVNLYALDAVNERLNKDTHAPAWNATDPVVPAP